MCEAALRGLVFRSVDDAMLDYDGVDDVGLAARINFYTFRASKETVKKVVGFMVEIGLRRYTELTIQFTWEALYRHGIYQLKEVDEMAIYMLTCVDVSESIAVEKLHEMGVNTEGASGFTLPGASLLQ